MKNIKLKVFVLISLILLSLLIFLYFKFFFHLYSEKIYLKTENSNLSTSYINSDLVCDDCNLILISLDTLRADHLGTYGYEKNTSPYLDSLAEKSLVFENHYTQSSLTASSHMTIFTSLYPEVHLVENAGATGDITRLSNHIETLPQILKKYGFSTAAFVAGGQIRSFFGFGKGYDEYQQDELIAMSISRNYDREFKDSNLFEWIKKNKDNRFFVFFHTYAVHHPYMSSDYELFEQDLPNISFPMDFEELDPFFKEKTWTELNYFDIEDYFNVSDEYLGSVSGDGNDLKAMIASYDGAIHHADSQIEVLIQFLKDNDLMNNTIIVITSDHGEELYDHGGFFHLNLYDENRHVPLIIKNPNNFHMRISKNSRHLDLTPTILNLLGIQYSPEKYNFQGISLLELLNHEAEDLEIYSRIIFNKFDIDLRSLQISSKKVITNFYGNDSTSQFFDLDTNPEEIPEKENNLEHYFDIEKFNSRIEEIRKENTLLSEALN